MKKPLAILLLILGSVLITAFTTLFTAVMFIVMAMMIPAGGAWALYSILAFFLLLVSHPINTYLREFFKRKYNVKAPVFVACFCLPTLIAAELANLKYMSLPPEHSTDELAALGLIAWLMVSGVLTVWLVLGTFFASVNARRMK